MKNLTTQERLIRLEVLVCIHLGITGFNTVWPPIMDMLFAVW